MISFSRLMVGLEGSINDLYLLKQVSGLTKTSDMKKLFLVHVASPKDVTYIRRGLTNAEMADKEEKTRNLIFDIITGAIDNYEEFDIEIIIKEGDRQEILLNLIEEHNIDLMVMGRKPRPGITSFSKRIANKASCSVIYFPRDSKSNYQRIVVPIDFTMTSKKALEKAFNYKGKFGNIDILPVHFFDIPTGYSKTGKSLLESVENMKRISDEKMRENIPNQFLTKFELFPNKKDNAPLKIFNYAISKGADLIVLGSKGRTNLAAFLKNSISTKLVELIYHIPILIDKKQGGKAMDSKTAIGSI